ncbi:fibronectin type III domain-containing protein, partial [uncultured Flavobacterium sp.]
MKKTLLFLFLLLVSNSFFAQITTPPDLTACGLGGAAVFDLTINQSVILSSVSNPNDYTVTYHETQLDAENNATSIPNSSSFMNINNPQTIYVRVENIETSEVEFTSFELLVNQTPLPLAAALFWCDPMELAIYSLEEAIPQITNGASSLTVSFHETLSDAEFNSNAIPNDIYAPMQFPVQILFARVEDFFTGCFAITTLTLNTNNCNQFCSAPIQLTLSNVTDTSATINWSSEPNSSNSYWQISIVPVGQQPDQNTTIVSQLNSFTVTGLTQNTCYSFYVRTVCFGVPGDFQVSEWSVPLEFCLMDCTNNGQCPEQLNLIAFVDENNNGIKEGDEILFNSGSFVYEINDSGETIYGNSGNGNFTIFEPNPDNNYHFSFEVNEAFSAYFSSTTTYSDITAPIGSGTSTYYFPITITQPYADVSVTLFANSQPRPGFTYTNTIAIKNNSYTTVPFGNISFTKDNDVTIISVSEISIVSTAEGFDYSYSDLTPFETRYVNVTMQVPTIPTVNLGDILTNSVSIEAIENEVNLANNISTLSQIVIGSYDPNDKNESHGGKIVFADFTADDYLYYTIRFENTGTAAAEFIRIEDTLENSLDETTFEMLNASHQYNVRRTDNQLVWNFLDIDLPPTIEDAELSHGFIHFKIKPKPGFALGDVIENTAEIYFDYNPPIITNTIETEFVENLSVADFSVSTVVLYPNPVKDSFQIKLNGNDSIQRIS